MLNNDFFSIIQWQSDPGSIHATIEINPQHKIFEGHFPGQPVVPGVCMLQIIKEMLESELKKKLTLIQADHLKFLSMIDPKKTTRIYADLNFQQAEGSSILLIASLFNEGTVYMKMKGIFSDSL